MTTSAVGHPDPIDWRDLIAAARATLVPQPPNTQPTAAAIRRAISTTYYAVFHALTASNAETLMGSAGDVPTAEAWLRIYRGLDHGQARRQLQQRQAGFSVETQAFSDLFCDLQIERHNADYNPAASFTAQSASNWVMKAEVVISDFLQTTATERAAVATLTLVRPR